MRKKKKQSEEIMIYLFKKSNCVESQNIQNTLKELVLSHEVINIDQNPDRLNGIPQDANFPVLQDGKKIIQGKNDILNYLEELEKIKAEWDKFQSDSCYCDDDGEIE